MLRSTGQTPRPWTFYSIRNRPRAENSSLSFARTTFLQNPLTKKSVRSFWNQQKPHQLRPLSGPRVTASISQSIASIGSVSIWTLRLAMPKFQSNLNRSHGLKHLEKESQTKLQSSSVHCSKRSAQLRSIILRAKTEQTFASTLLKVDMVGASFISRSPTKIKLHASCITTLLS